MSITCVMEVPAPQSFVSCQWSSTMNHNPVCSVIKMRTGNKRDCSPAGVNIGNTDVEGDRFVRPLDPISLGDFARMIEPITQRSYRTRGFFPSIGTSSDQQFLYYGLRVRGFGPDTTECRIESDATEWLFKSRRPLSLRNPTIQPLN